MKFSFSCVYSFFKCSFRSFFFQVSIQQDIRVWDWRERCLRPAETVWHGQWGTQVCPLTQFLFAWFLFGRGSPFFSFLYCLVSAQSRTLEPASCVAFGTEDMQGHRQLFDLRVESKSQAIMIKTNDRANLDHCEQTWVTQIMANWECGRWSQIRLEGSSEWHQEELSVQHPK